MSIRTSHDYVLVEANPSRELTDVIKQIGLKVCSSLETTREFSHSKFSLDQVSPTIFPWVQNVFAISPLHIAIFFGQSLRNQSTLSEDALPIEITIVYRKTTNCVNSHMYIKTKSTGLHYKWPITLTSYRVTYHRLQKLSLCKTKESKREDRGCRWVEEKWTNQISSTESGQKSQFCEHWSTYSNSAEGCRYT